MNSSTKVNIPDYWKNKSLEDLKGEIWIPVKDFEGLYEVSNLGRLKSLDFYESFYRKDLGKTIFRLKKEKIKYLKPSKAGYILVKLYKDKIETSIRMHRVVALSFIPNPENKPQVNHINGIKHDNRLVNLEWNTQSENMLHAYEKGLNTPTSQKGFKNSNCKLDLESILKIRKHKKKYGSAIDFCLELGISKSTYHDIRAGRKWSEI